MSVTNKYVNDAGVTQGNKIPLAINDQAANGKRVPYDTLPVSNKAKVVVEKISSNKAGIINVFDSVASDSRLRGNH